MKEFLIVRRYMVKASSHMNAPLVEAWRVVGRFRADSEGEAIFRAYAATGCDKPEDNLRVYGSVTKPS